ncbi:hypothetical protein R5L02_21050, partial [Acinetobacter baumannii]|uniref:hypothetical protein n=1 Tax=Acinetobacter baumannii TaxID=470 RepID=UPI0029536680
SIDYHYGLWAYLSCPPALSPLIAVGVGLIGFQSCSCSIDYHYGLWAYLSCPPALSPLIAVGVGLIGFQ